MRLPPICAANHQKLIVASVAVVGDGSCQPRVPGRSTVHGLPAAVQARSQVRSDGSRKTWIIGVVTMRSSGFKRGGKHTLFIGEVRKGERLALGLESNNSEDPVWEYVTRFESVADSRVVGFRLLFPPVARRVTYGRSKERACTGTCWCLRANVHGAPAVFHE